MSSINEEEFEELIDGLEEAGKISKKDARANLKHFKTLRKAADDREKKHAEKGPLNKRKSHRYLEPV